MLALSRAARVGRLVAERPGRSAVFERFGIDYCCQGRLELEQACTQLGLDPDAVLSALEDSDARVPAEPNFLDWQLGDLLDRVVDLHHAYLHREMRPVGDLAREVAKTHGDAHPELGRLAHAFEFFREDMEAHLAKEEEVLFPALRELASGRVLPGFFQGDLHVPLLVMEGDHERSELSLRFFRSVTRGYVAPPEADEAWRSLLERLAGIEEDLHRHLHIENEVIHARARDLNRRR